MREVVLGDCIELSPKYLSENTVDLIITDPPYGINGASLHKHYNRKESNAIDGYIDITADEYPLFSDKWIGEAYKVLRPNGQMFVISGWTHLVHILKALNKYGFQMISHNIWKYNFGVYTTRKFVSSHYHILYVEKPGEKPAQSIDDTVWYIKKEYRRGQTKNKNQLPSMLLKRMIDLGSSPGDLIVDFFLGSGSTLVEARQMGRRGFGFEKNPIAYQFAKENVEKAQFIASQKFVNEISSKIQNLSLTDYREITGNRYNLIIGCGIHPQINKAIDALKTNGSMFLIVNSEELLKTLETVKIPQINHIVCYTKTKLHILFFTKGAITSPKRIFNQHCRFGPESKTSTGGSACYADMEDVWSFDESGISKQLVEKIVAYTTTISDKILSLNDCIYKIIEEMRR